MKEAQTELRSARLLDWAELHPVTDLSALPLPHPTVCLSTFCYAQELGISSIRTLNSSSFVTIILTAERTVDESRMRRLIKLAGAKEVTFHRAFDQTHNLEDALEQIIAVGCRRLLTSGGKPTVQAGLDTIPELAQRARDRLRIAAGGGLTPVIAAELGRITSVDLHVSLQRGGRLRASRHDPLWDNRNVTAEISVEDVRKMATIIAGYQAR